MPVQVQVRRSGRQRGEQPQYNEDWLAAKELGIDRCGLWEVQELPCRAGQFWACRAAGRLVTVGPPPLPSLTLLPRPTPLPRLAHRLDLIALPRRRRVGVDPSTLSSIRAQRIR